MNPRMKKHKYIWLIVILLIVIIVGVRAFMFLSDIEDTTQEEDIIITETPEVRVTSVKKGDIAQKTWMTGNIVAEKAVEVVPKIPARLEKMRLEDGTLIEEGTLVKKGEIVAVLDHEDLEAALQSAEASYKSAQASHRMARVVYEDAEREKNRWERLREEGVGTEREYDQVRTAYERARAEIDLSETKIEQSRSALNQVRVNYKEAWIKAPLTGIVSRKYVDEGSFVSQGTPLLRIIDIDSVEITGGLPGKYYPLVKEGKTQSNIRVEAYPDQDFTGLVTRIRPELDQRTRTVPVTISIPNPGHILKPGMYARIEIILQQFDGVLLIPDSAVMDIMGEPHVYIVTDDIVKLRPIELGYRQENIYEIPEGVEEGETVVLSGHQMLEEGMQVIPRKENIAQ